MNNRLFLIDTSAYFYRAYFALPPLSNSAGLADQCDLRLHNHDLEAA